MSTLKVLHGFCILIIFQRLLSAGGEGGADTLSAVFNYICISMPLNFNLQPNCFTGTITYTSPEPLVGSQIVHFLKNASTNYKTKLT